MTAEEKKVFQRKAYAANRPRRIPDGAGGWETIQPLPRLTYHDIEIVYLRTGGICMWCRIFAGLAGTLEHVKRIAAGGTNEMTNLDWACKRCNEKGYYRD